jgi:hypothetical protein
MPRFTERFKDFWRDSFRVGRTASGYVESNRGEADGALRHRLTSLFRNPKVAGIITLSPPEATFHLSGRFRGCSRKHEISRTFKQPFTSASAGKRAER